MSGSILTAKRIEELLRELHSKLAAEAVVGELYLVGGAVMCLVFNSRPSTLDVAGYFAPTERMRALARVVADENDLSPSWLNDAVKGYLSSKGEFDPFLDLPHLKVFTARSEYLLAMKCLAMRIGAEFHDEADVRYLLRALNIERYEDAVQVITRYYPLERFPQKTLYALAELLPAAGC